MIPMFVFTTLFAGSSHALSTSFSLSSSSCNHNNNNNNNRYFGKKACVRNHFFQTTSFIARTSSSSSSSSLQQTSMNNNDSYNSSSSSLEGKSLVSIEECLDAYKQTSNQGGSSSISWVDASWWHKGDLNGRDLFEQGPRIPGSVHLDMDDIAARGDLFPELNPKNLPHMLPPKELFAAAMDNFGIQKSNHIIIYGRQSCFFTPRTLFLFRYMGHDPRKVHLMQGSFEEWIAAGGEVETEPTTVAKAEELLASNLENNNKYDYQVTSNAENVCDMNDMLRYMNINNNEKENQPTVTEEHEDVIILDPRGSSFASKGHMPGAIHIPYSKLVMPDNSLKFKPTEELRSIFESAGVDVKSERQVICSCGSGVSVCSLFLALELCGRDSKNTFLYDGSWAEWGNDPNTPKIMPSK